MLAKLKVENNHLPTESCTFRAEDYNYSGALHLILKIRSTVAWKITGMVNHGKI
jgi:hypothetical protein